MPQCNIAGDVNADGSSCDSKEAGVLLDTVIRVNMQRDITHTRVPVKLMPSAQQSMAVRAGRNKTPFLCP